MDGLALMDGLVCIASQPHEPHREIHGAMLDAAGEQHVVLDTCERLETYAYFPDSQATQVPKRLVGAAIEGVSIIRGQDAVRRLMRIASGLESRIIGEPHVLGQVRAAYLEGQQLRPVGTILSSLFCAGIRVGRRIRNETKINAGRESAVTLTVLRLLEGLVDLRDKSIGIVGSGAIARDVAQNLLQHGVADLRVYSRSPGRANLSAFPGNVLVRGHAKMHRELGKLDAIVACTRTTQPIFRAVNFEGCIPGLIVIDLGSPANVALLGESPNRMRLTRLTELRRAAPSSEILAAERIVAEELGRFENWYRQRRVARSIQQLVRDADLPPTRSTPTLHEKIMQVKAQVAA